MHTLILVAAGLAILLLFLAAAHFVNARRGAGFVDGGRLFIWFWLVATIANGAYGAIVVGIGILVELAVFVIVFGVPAGAAWYLSRMIRRRHAPKPLDESASGDKPA